MTETKHGDGFAKWEKQWFDWVGFDEKGDADRAFVPEMLKVFIDYYAHAYNLEDITDATLLRECNGLMWQWCRLWNVDAERYDWRWIPVGAISASAH